MKFSLSVILDSLFTAFISFILLFILFNYRLTFLISITLSITFSLIILIFAYIYLRKKKNTYNLSKIDMQTMEIMANQLCLYDKKEQLEVFTNLLNKLNIKFEIKKDFIYIKEQEICIFPLFSFDQITKTDIVKIFNTISRNQLAYIFAKEFTNEIESFSARFDGRIILVKKESLYKILSEQDLLPKQKLPFKEQSKVKLSSLKNILNKKNSKKLLGFGLLFLFMSLFVFAKIYYVVVGSIFLIISLFSRLFGTEKAIADK